MKYLALAGIVVGIVLINYYLMKKLYPLVNKIVPGLNPKVYYIVLFIFVLIMMLGTSKGLLPVPDIVKNFIASMSSRWMGLFIYLLMYCVMSDLLLLIGKAVKLIQPVIPEKIKVITAAVVLAGAVLTITFGEIHANNIYVKSYDVDIKNTDMNNVSVVLVTDIHLGAQNSEKRLPKIVERINEQNADIVCISGDIFDNDFTAINDTDEVKRQLKSIKSKYGVYACLGNHDAGDTFGEMLTFLDECNITLLNEESTVIDGKFNLVGRVDASPIGGAETITRTSYTDILSTIDNDLPIVVMEHTPSNTEEYGKETALVLSGHTHDGQLFPGNHIVHFLYGDKAYGQSELKDGAQLIVSSGAGTWGMPIRIGTNCEVVNIILK